MPVELKVPAVGESITEVTIGDWLKAEGDFINADEPVVVVESEKANLEVPAPSKGRMSRILKKTGDTATIGEVIGYIEAGDAADTKLADPEATATPAGAPAPPEQQAEVSEPPAEQRVMPSAKRVMATHGLKAGDVRGSGPGGRVLKEDAVRAWQSAEKGAAVTEKAQPAESTEPKAEAKAEPKTAEKPEQQVPGKLPAGQEADATATLAKAGAVSWAEQKAQSKGPAAAAPKATSAAGAKAQAPDPATPPAETGGRTDETVAMSPLRRTIARRLVEAQQNAALLTTFNEIDMTEVLALRKQHQDTFVEKYGIKLGFMSFFIKGVIEGLKEFPGLNAEIRGNDIVYHHYYDIGVAVGGGKGLVVPVLRNAERMSFAEIEKAIADLATRAKDNKLTLDELKGGTFTLSNGGVYGSLLSTPIVNPPQSGVLGMHAIQERPIAIDGQVVVRPMMYVALTYDHRLVDGREAVTFLRRVKAAVETPVRILLEV